MLVKAFSEDYQLKFRPHQVEGPASPRDYLDWNARLRKWRLEQQNNKKENCTTTGYDVPGLQVRVYRVKLIKHLLISYIE
jgi:iron(II)-dependent oxidoreductase